MKIWEQHDDEIKELVESWCLRRFRHIVETGPFWGEKRNETNGVITKGKYKPKKPIVVFNSASLCGFTEQLSQFEELYQSGKIIPMAIPTNNFGQQEPGTDEEISKHYKEKYRVTFPVLVKADLEHPFFKTFGKPTWNFNKWLFDKENHNECP